jgi:type IV secretory pathway TraG/TraD family ATPase VirD4
MTQHTVTLGHTTFRNRQMRVDLKSNDRLRHMYVIGKTGTGKSTLYQNMALQDIMAGAGVCFVDPHGEGYDWLLARIPAERLKDVVLFDPTDTDWPVGLNLLEWKTESEKDFLVAEVIQIFYKLFDPDQQGIVGPQFEHWLRNAALTVMAHPTGGTLLEIPRLFTDSEFEAERRRYVTDKVVLAFWEQQMAQTAHFHRSEMLNYFTSKFGRFMTNALMRNIMGQKQSTISLRDCIDQQKILLVNLSKGKLGELNSYMLGLILMTKLAAAVMQRADVPAQERTPFYLFVDEFQNVMTDTFASLLSEARKYGLAVHLAHQYMPQLSEKMRDAVLGNVATLVAFQVGSPDVEVLLPEFEAHTSRRPSERLQADDFQYLPQHTFYIRLTLDNTTHPPFRAESHPPLDSPAMAGSLGVNLTPEQVRAVSRLRYASPRFMLE